jgi:hypothetical protein
MKTLRQDIPSPVGDSNSRPIEREAGQTLLPFVNYSCEDRMDLLVKYSSGAKCNGYTQLNETDMLCRLYLNMCRNRFGCFVTLHLDCQVSDNVTLKFV